jgi:hypothetical protein
MQGSIATGFTPSTGVTCGVLCLRTAQNARKSVPQLYSGVWCVFGEVRKKPNPTRMRSVREPGSLTLPPVTPIEGFTPSAGFTPLQVSLANGQNMHAGACQPILVGFMVFFDEVEKTINPTPKGSVREPGSLTLPQVTPIEGFTPLRASACKRLANARRGVPAHSGGEQHAGTRFPQTPTGPPRRAGQDRYVRIRKRR